MKSAVVRLLLLFGIFFSCITPASGANPSASPTIISGGPASGGVNPYGIDQRVPWKNSRIIGSPDPPLPYEAKRVFPKLRFKEPVDMAHTPVMDRLFVAEQSGKFFFVQKRPCRRATRPRH